MKCRYILLVLCVFFVFSCQDTKDTENQNQKSDVKKVEPLDPKDKLVFNNKVSPMETIKDLDLKVDRFKAGPGLTQEDIEENKRIKSQIVRGIFDIRELCKLSLGIHWRPLSSKQRDDFVELMTRLLERKAIFSKEQIKDSSKPYKINYKKETFINGDKSEAKVSTEVVTSKQKLNIDYDLLRHEKVGWQVFDIIVDEASLMKNYQFQFNTIINRHGFDELVKRMESKLKKLE